MTASLVFPSFRYFSPSATAFCFLTSGLCEHPKPPKAASPTMSRTADRPEMLFAIGFTVAPRRGRTSHKSGTGLTLEKIPSKETLSQPVDWPTESNERGSARPIEGLLLCVSSWLIVWLECFTHGHLTKG